MFLKSFNLVSTSASDHTPVKTVLTVIHIVPCDPVVGIKTTLRSNLGDFYGAQQIHLKYEKRFIIKVITSEIKI